MEIIYDIANLNDIPELVRLRILYMIDDFGSITDEERAGMEKQLPGYFERELGKKLIAFVARAEGRLVAAAYLLIIEKPANPFFLNGLDSEVLSVYTEEGYRGKGICTNLMRNMIDYAAEHKISRIDLMATDEGYPIYKKLGFEDKVQKYKDMRLVVVNQCIKTGKKMCIDLKPIAREDIETVWKMQVEAFSDLLEKYQDYDMSPAAEDMDKVLARFEQPWTTYFFIMANNEKVGVIRVVDKKDGSRKRISPIWIMPEYRNKGYAQQAILAAEKKYGSNHWCLDTILQEKGNLHLYEKLGYHQTGRIDRVNDRMDIVYYEKD